MSLTINETLKWFSSLPILMQKAFWWRQCSGRYIIFLSPPLHPPFSPSLISLMVSVDGKHHVYLLTQPKIILLFAWTNIYVYMEIHNSTPCFRGHEKGCRNAWTVGVCPNTSYTKIAHSFLYMAYSNLNSGANIIINNNNFYSATPHEKLTAL